MVIAIFKTRAAEKREEKEIYNIWADTIKDRDNRECFICATKYGLCSHHIIPREHKEYLLSLDNGITLCLKHHKFSRNISAHNNPLAFFMWLDKYKPDFMKIARERMRNLLKEKEGIEI